MLSDVSDSIYIGAYFSGVMIPLLFRIALYLIWDIDGSNVQLGAVSIGMAIVFILYGWDAYTRPEGEAENIVVNKPTLVLYDAYSACFVYSECFPTQDSDSKCIELKSSLLLEKSSKGKQAWLEAQDSKRTSDQSDKNRITSVTDQSVNAPKYWSLVYCLSYYLPRFVFRRYGIPCAKRIAGSRWELWMFTTIFSCIVRSYVYAMFYYAEFFRIHEEWDQLWLFAVFVIIATFLRVLLKRAGLLLDTRKMGGCSLFFVGEYCALCFYYTYYRVLFESLKEWVVFFTFQVLHLFSEWCLYPLRCHPPFITFILSIEKQFPLLKGTMMPSNTDMYDWLHFISLDFGVRIVVMISTGIGMLILLLTLDLCEWTSSYLKQSGKKITHVSVLIIIAVVLEVLNAAAIGTFFCKRGIHVSQKVQHCFSDMRYAMFTILFGADLFMNPVYSFSTDNTWGK